MPIKDKLIFLFFSLFPIIINSKKLIKNFSSFCNTYEYKNSEFYSSKSAFEIQKYVAEAESKNQQKRKGPGRVPFAYETELVNIQAFTSALSKGLQPIRETNDSYVFPFEFKINQNHIEAYVLVFLTYIGDNCRVETEKTQQELFINNLMYCEVLIRLPQGIYYFPVNYASTDVTNYLPSYGRKMTIDSEQQHLFEEPEDSLIALTMWEYYDLILGDYVNQIEDQEVPAPPLAAQIDLFFAAISAVEKAYKTCFICNINLESFSLKLLTSDEKQNLINQKIPIIELEPGKFYQLKLIDFSLAKSGTKTERICTSGKPGFTPPEMLINNATHERFDVYSLGMALLDIQMAVFGLGNFSATDYVFYKHREEKTTEFLPKIIESIEESFIVKKMSLVMENYKSYFLAYLIKQVPSVEADIEGVANGREFSEIPVSEYLFHNTNLFRAMILAAIQTYFNVHFLHHKTKAAIKPYVDQMASLKETILQTELEQRTQMNAEYEYLENKKKLILLRNTTSVNLVNLCVAMIAVEKSQRIPLKNAIDKLKEFRDKFQSEEQFLVDDIQLYEDQSAEEDQLSEVNLPKSRVEMVRPQASQKQVQSKVRPRKKVVGEDFDENIINGKTYLTI